LSAAQALREAINAPMTGVERVEYDQEVAALRAQSNPADFDTDWAAGRALTLDQAIAFALG
jgi:hypothetical protein